MALTTVPPTMVSEPESLKSPSGSWFPMDICLSRSYMDDASPALVYGFGDLNKGGPSTPSTASTSSITAEANSAVPIDELLSPSFLLLFEETLPTSWTVWDHCLDALNEGENPVACIEDLIIAFEPLLALNVISEICRTLGALEHSILGVETVLIPSMKNILGDILSDLKERAYPPSHTLVGRVDDGWQQVSWRKPRNNAEGGGGARRGGCRRSGGKGSRRFIRGNGGGRGSGGGGGDDQQGILRRANENAQVFRGLVHVPVNMSVYITPEKDQERSKIQRRGRSIRERARAFAEHGVVSAFSIPYDPHNINGVACLYHGTRLRMADGFSRLGIQPFKRDTEFSSHPAFYITNDVASAFEFPLHNRLARDPQDTVAVLCFEVDLQILHGDLPTPSGKLFDVLWFESDDNGAWQEFCTYNLYSPSPKIQHGYDVVIRCMCYPNRKERTVVPRQTEGLVVQVAFCSEEAWTWVGSCVKRMYVENHVEQEG